MKLTKPQIIAFICLALLVAFGLYRFAKAQAGKRGGQDTSDTENETKIEEDQYDEALEDQEEAGIVQSYPSAKYEELADQLEEQLCPSWAFTNVYGKSDKCRYYVAHCHNIKDWTLLKKAFGRRPHCKYVFVPYDQCPKKNLPTLLSEELNKSARQEINDLFYARGIPATV